MKFRNDINPATTWVISDTHFHHGNIADFCHRPEDHDQIMIAEWRKVVPDDATVLHLGDLNYGNNSRFRHLVAKELTGARKLLIQGNHDRQRFSFYRQSGFQIVKPFKLKYSQDPWKCEFCIDGQVPPFRRGPIGAVGKPCVVCSGSGYTPTKTREVSFSHYPWNVDDDGVMPSNHTRVHGHIHNNGYTRESFVPFLLNHINLSVEQTKYRPVNLKALLDAALFGDYAATTDDQIAEAVARREERKQ